MNKKLFIMTFLCFFIFSLGSIAQEPDRIEVMQEKELMRIQKEDPGSGLTIYVDSAIGDDADGKGTEKKPYKTINRALEVVGFGDTIEVGPGTYNESIDMRSYDPIIIKGAGKDSSIINGYIFVDGCDYLRIAGFTINREPGVGAAVYLENVDNAFIIDCIINTDQMGIFTRLHTATWVYDTDIKGVGWLYGAFANTSSAMWLIRCTVSDFGIGIVSNSGSDAYLYDSEVYNNSSYGVSVTTSARLVLEGSIIRNNPSGIMLKGGGKLSTSSSNKIYENDFGIHIRSGSSAVLTNIEIFGNTTGIFMTEASTLVFEPDVSIYGNEKGVFMVEFSHAFFYETAISGNSEWDVEITRGSQAMCNPDLIDKLYSECPHCQK